MSNSKLGKFWIMLVLFVHMYLMRCGYTHVHTHAHAHKWAVELKNVS